MATFKAVVQKAQQRKTDGKFPVSIRVTQNSKVAYIPTGLHVEKRMLTKSFEIKDQFVIERTNKTIREYETKLLSLSTQDLMCMSVKELSEYLSTRPVTIDFLEYCDELIAKDTDKVHRLSAVVGIIRNEMGIQKMATTEFTSAFLRKFKEHLDNRSTIQGGRFGKAKKSTAKRLMANSTKNIYLDKLTNAWKRLVEETNTEFDIVIRHDPLRGLTHWREDAPKRKSFSAEHVYAILNYVNRKTNRRDYDIAVDILKLEFCMCGMNTKDLITMPPSCYDKSTGRITYERSKTRKRRADNALISIRVEPEIKKLIKKYAVGKKKTLFVFPPCIKESNVNMFLNNKLKNICKELNIQYYSAYAMRHSWATIARNKCGVSKDDIGFSLCHAGDNPLTDRYAEQDWGLIDSANRKVLDYVFHREKTEGGV